MSTTSRSFLRRVFDRGHFASIKLLGVDGRTLVARELGSVTDDVPAALKRLLPFEAPTGEALVSSVWRQLGRVLVVVHPRFAYSQLWHTVVETLAWLFVLYAFALLAMRRFLRGILRPLEAIEQAALAIGRREFGVVRLETGTRELQRVGMAMNDLSVKLREVIAEESNRADRLHQQAFEDPLTGTLNRRGLIQRVQNLLSEGTEISSGALAFVSMIGLEEVNRSLGGAKGDELVQQLGEVVGTPSAGDPPIVGRWQGASFAVLLPNRDLAAARAWGEQVCSRFVALMREQSALLDRLWQVLQRDSALPQAIAVNISAQSLADTAFRGALRERLERAPAIARRIIFEVGGYAAVHHVELTAAFAAEVRAKGARFAIDGFELSGASLRVVHRLLPEYVKLTQGYSRGIASDGDLRFLVESLIRIVRPLEIKLIASNVEDPAVLDQLAVLGFDGFQGYAGDRPAPL